MAVEKTLSILKPDATERNITGKINAMFEENGLKIIAQKMVTLSESDASLFYQEHKDRPFFKDLVSYMISAPVVLQVLEGEDAVAKNRTLMGATNPKDASVGTIRKIFAISIDKNTVHGSDSLDSANREVAFFFPELI